MLHVSNEFPEVPINLDFHSSPEYAEALKAFERRVDAEHARERKEMDARHEHERSELRARQRRELDRIRGPQVNRAVADDDWLDRPDNPELSPAVVAADANYPDRPPTSTEATSPALVNGDDEEIDAELETVAHETPRPTESPGSATASAASKSGDAAAPVVELTRRQEAAMKAWATKRAKAASTASSPATEGSATPPKGNASPSQSIAAHVIEVLRESAGLDFTASELAVEICRRHEGAFKAKMQNGKRDVLQQLQAEVSRARKSFRKANGEAGVTVLRMGKGDGRKRYGYVWTGPEVANEVDLQHYYVPMLDQELVDWCYKNLSAGSWFRNRAPYSEGAEYASRIWFQNCRDYLAADSAHHKIEYGDDEGDDELEE